MHDCDHKHVLLLQLSERQGPLEHVWISQFQTQPQEALVRNGGFFFIRFSDDRHTS